MPEVDEQSLAAFRKWKSKRLWPEQALNKQKDLREFREKFGVDKASNFHCPWCFDGSLYTQEDPTISNLYVCRRCELQFVITCVQQSELDSMVEKKKQERKDRRETSKTDKKLITVINTLVVEALHFKEITCQGCGKKIPPDTEYCTCGWKNPLVGLGNA